MSTRKREIVTAPHQPHVHLLVYTYINIYTYIYIYIHVYVYVCAKLARVALRRKQAKASCKKGKPTKTSKLGWYSSFTSAFHLCDACRIFTIDVLPGRYLCFIHVSSICFQM